jgi:hypothetical protein
MYLYKQNTVNFVFNCFNFALLFVTQIGEDYEETKRLRHTGLRFGKKFLSESPAILHKSLQAPHRIRCLFINSKKCKELKDFLIHICFKSLRKDNNRL